MDLNEVVGATSTVIDEPSTVDNNTGGKHFEPQSPADSPPPNDDIPSATQADDTAHPGEYLVVESTAAEPAAPKEGGGSVLHLKRTPSVKAREEMKVLEDMLAANDPENDAGGKEQQGGADQGAGDELPLDQAIIDEAAALLDKLTGKQIVELDRKTRDSIAAALHAVATRLQSNPAAAAAAAAGTAVDGEEEGGTAVDAAAPEASNDNDDDNNNNKPALEFKPRASSTSIAPTASPSSSPSPSPSPPAEGQDPLSLDWISAPHMPVQPRTMGSMVLDHPDSTMDTAEFHRTDSTGTATKPGAVTSSLTEGNALVKTTLDLHKQDDDVMDEQHRVQRERLLKFVKSSVGIFLFFVFIGVMYCTLRLRWPVGFSFYWTIVTALTVGYGDSPVCNIAVNTTDDDVAGSGFSNSGCGFRSVRDSDGDMVFVMIYSTMVVAIALSMLTEFMESLEAEQRKREAKAQRVLLEGFFQGEKIEEAKAKAVQIAMLTAIVPKSIQNTEEGEDFSDSDDADDADDAVNGVNHEKHASRRKTADGARRRKTEVNIGRLNAGRMAMNWKRNADIAIEMREEAKRHPTKSSRGYACTKIITSFKNWFKDHPVIRDLLAHSLLVTFGILFMVLYQKERFVDSLYWVVISGLAVGYGDIHPIDDVGYGIGFFYITLVVLSTLTILMKMVNALRSQSKVHEVLSKTFDANVMEAFDRHKDGQISRDEYLAGVLVMLDKIDFDTVDLINKHFDVLDVDKGGQISKEEIMASNKSHQQNSHLILRSGSGAFLESDMTSTGKSSWKKKKGAGSTGSVDLLQQAKRRQSLEKQLIKKRQSTGANGAGHEKKGRASTKTSSLPVFIEGAEGPDDDDNAAATGRENVKRNQISPEPTQMNLNATI